MDFAQICLFIIIGILFGLWREMLGYNRGLDIGYVKGRLFGSNETWRAIFIKLQEWQYLTAEETKEFERRIDQEITRLQQEEANRERNAP